MRTTITLDADAAALIKRDMKQRKVSMKQAVNDAIRAGLAAPATERYRTRPVDMGLPTVSLDAALRLAGELEDEELVRKMRMRK